MKKIFYGILKILLSIIVILMAIFAIINVYSLFYNELNNTEYAKLFGYSVHIVESDNLSPIYDINDTLIVKEQYEYSVDEYILFNYNGTYIVAQIEDTVRGLYKVNDNTNSIKDDYEINDGLVVGKVVYNIKGFGKIYDILSSTYSMIIYTIAVIVYFMLFSKRNLN